MLILAANIISFSGGLFPEPCHLIDAYRYQLSLNVSLLKITELSIVLRLQLLPILQHYEFYLTSLPHI